MHSRNAAYILRKLWVGFTLRCPNCEQGRLFNRHRRFNLHMESTCPYCEVRFERNSGDSIGAVYINVALAELTAMTGFFTINSLFHPPMLHQLVFWVPYIVVFALLFYPRARGLWTGVLWLTGGVYADPDYMRDYIAPKSMPQDREPQESDQ